MTETPKRGRPQGQRYPYTKSLKLREVDVKRLERLAQKLDRDHSAVIRRAIEVLAEQEGIDVPGGAE